MASFEASKQVFKFGGGREAVITTEKAEELIAAAIKEVDSPSHINLSNKSFSSEAALCIAKTLATFHAIEIADISDMIAGRAEEDALLTLQIICDSIVGNKLVELNVSDNALGSKGVIACKALIVCKSLQRLYFCNNGMSADACVLISELLLEGGCAPLTALHFYNNMSGNGGAVAIAEMAKACPLLEDFRFSATRSTSEGCLAVAKALVSLPLLRKLDLQDNSFSEEAGELLADSLKRQPLLTYLNLRDAGLGEEGTSAVIKALKEGKPRLEFLDLSGNDLTATHSQELSELLSMPHMEALRELSLDDNELESEGAVFVAKGVKGLLHLETLSISTCEVTAAGMYTLARSLARLPRFLTIKADGNRLFPVGLEEIQKVLMGAGKMLAEMEDNDEDGDEDGFEDALELGEKEEKALKQEEKDKKNREADRIMNELLFMKDTSVVAAEETKEEAKEVVKEVEVKEGEKRGNAKEEKAKGEEGEGGLTVAIEDEDELSAMMMGASISAGAISDMPTP